MAIAPRPEQLEQLAKNVPKDGALLMLNLLKFKEKAEYADGRDSELTGEQAYALYGQGVGPLILKHGGRPVFASKCGTLVIGDGELAWDAVAIVEYPSLEAFGAMTSSEAYQEIHVHRDAGLAHQLLVHCYTPEQALAVAGLTGARSG